jgi:hypothetical protein
MFERTDDFLAVVEEHILQEGMRIPAGVVPAQVHTQSHWLFPYTIYVNFDQLGVIRSY